MENFSNIVDSRVVSNQRACSDVSRLSNDFNVEISGFVDAEIHHLTLLAR